MEGHIGDQRSKAVMRYLDRLKDAPRRTDFFSRSTSFCMILNLGMANCINTVISASSKMCIRDRSRFASPRINKVLLPAVQLLAGIPSVVYGFFGMIRCV